MIRASAAAVEKRMLQMAARTAAVRTAPNHGRFSGSQSMHSCQAQLAAQHAAAAAARARTVEALVAGLNWVAVGLWRRLVHAPRLEEAAQNMNAVSALKAAAAGCSHSHCSGNAKHDCCSGCGT